jgi:Cu+-exporting ATPase
MPFGITMTAPTHRADKKSNYEQLAVKIKGMTCAMCVQTVEHALRNVPGIISTNVNLSSEKAFITHDPAHVSINDIQRAIEKAGYEYGGIEGETPEEDATYQADLVRKRNRFIFGFAFGMPLMILMYLPVHLPLFMPYVMFLLATPVFLYVSSPIFAAAYRALKNRVLNMDVMYSMGIGVAFAASIMGTFGIILSREFIFYETSIMLASFLTFGRYLEMRAKSKTSEAIKKLLGLQPHTALVVRNKQIIETDIKDVHINDIVMVRPGDKVPVDGVVVEGTSFVDESMISGEPVPVHKHINEHVVAGTINKNSVLKINALKVGKDTLLAQIIKLVDKAQGSKPPVQKIADRVVSYFIPTVLSIAILSSLVWYFVFDYTLLFSLTRMISVLVVACPCALGLATPTAVTVGIGRAAELGVLIKNSDVLEISEKIDTIAFDKTGTLTLGKPIVTNIIPYNGSEVDVLSYAASVEQNSPHPFAQAVVNAAAERGITLTDPTNLDTAEGRGVTASVQGHAVIIGNPLFIREKTRRSLTDTIEKAIARLEKQGTSVAVIVVDGQILGLIGIADQLKKDTRRALDIMKNMHKNLVMLTGDNQQAAESLADELGISHILANVLPQDKAQNIKYLQEKGTHVAYIGDGINDAPALAQADIGIALGHGTDIAIESGEVVLMRDNLIDAAAALQLGKKVLSRIRQNLFWAFAYNIALIPVAAGILYPSFGISFKPEFAGLAMALSSVTVITLSLLLKRYTPPARTSSERG